jgi:cbb3-type cytochrome oxidase subunit 1
MFIYSQGETMTSFSKRFLLCAVAYVVLGMALGTHMGAQQDFKLAPIHGHMNLVGWVTMALFAWFYNTVPAAAGDKLAQAHFWAAQIGMVMFIIGLYIVLNENMTGEPVLIAGELLTGISMLIFGYKVWKTDAT